MVSFRKSKRCQHVTSLTMETVGSRLVKPKNLLGHCCRVLHFWILWMVCQWVESWCDIFINLPNVGLSTLIGVPGEFLGTMGQLFSVPKLNRFHVDVFWIFFINSRKILYVPLKWSNNFLKSRTSIGYYKNSTSSYVTTVDVVLSNT